MKTLCYPGDDGRCPQCSEVVPPRTAKTCRAKPGALVPIRCAHVVDPSSPVEHVGCTTCQGNVRKKYQRCTKCGGLVAVSATA